MINLTRMQVVKLLMTMKTEMQLYPEIKATDERMAALDFAAESILVDEKYNLLYEGRNHDDYIEKEGSDEQTNDT